MALGMDSWFVLKCQNVHKRFGLCQNTQVMLQALEDTKTTAIDMAEVGRMLRLSPQRRQAMINTIRKCTERMTKQERHKEDETRECALIIHMCTEVLEIANRPSPTVFPFLKLPREIRARVLRMIVCPNPKACRMPALKRIQDKYRCNCANPEVKSLGLMAKQQFYIYRTLGAALRDEFFQVYYDEQTQYFSCCCELLGQLKANSNLFNHLRKAEIHWCGPQSDMAFIKLAECPNLKEVTIKISKATTATFNKREEMMSDHFLLNYKTKRITDSLGADELFAIRGILDVDVQHIQAAQKLQLTEFDRQGLLSALRATIKQPKPTTTRAPRGNWGMYLR
ncbi:hypothetical protein CORC01_11931 [Colletotrichum orchidophilum]|uniref:Uncharacterized protein n=1 Tax=Colletotrichum orchidophilum TaxID=1209926 RepID=A0A1G4AUJ8_9PEZI|nr:uncharacterized protein CORC01_11931 [Colletotrichum orchidophilum]OHE92781.1 hypothetical protein CORC01_11931 [Colletotrichum orchidophilum]